MPRQLEVVDLTLDEEEVVNGTDLSDHSLLEAVNAIDLTLDDDDLDESKSISSPLS